MKKSYVLFIALVTLFFSCKGKPNADTANTDTSAKLTYPFKPKYSINAKMGDEHNALIVLNCLKKYIDGDMKGAIENFGDTVEFVADQFYFKGKKDSLATILGQTRSDMVSVSKNFDTWLTTYYPDTKETWVTLWYIEK